MKPMRFPNDNCMKRWEASYAGKRKRRDLDWPRLTESSVHSRWLGQIAWPGRDAGDVGQPQSADGPGGMGDGGRRRVGWWAGDLVRPAQPAGRIGAGRM